MTLHLYLARRFLWRFAALFMGFFALAVITDATALLGQFDSARVGLTDTLRLVLLKAPTGVYQLLPMIVVLASLALFLGLSRSSELVATRAAGFSALKSLVAPVLAAFIVGLIAVLAFNPLASATLRKFESETGRYRSGTVSSFSLTRSGLWLRQGSPLGQTVIFAKRANFDATRLSGVTFFEFTDAGIALRRIETSFASLSNGAWHLGPGKYWQINQQGQVPDKTAREFDTLSLPSDLTSDQILNSFGDPATISIWDTQSFISRLERSGFSTSRHRVHFQIELATPVLLMGMVLLGAAFSMRHARSARTGLMVLITVMAGLAVFILQDFAEILGSNGAVPVLAAAWVPPLSAILFALGMILHLEDG